MPACAPFGKARAKRRSLKYLSVIVLHWMKAAGAPSHRNYLSAMEQGSDGQRDSVPHRALFPVRSTRRCGEASTVPSPSRLQ